MKKRCIDRFTFVVCIITIISVIVSCGYCYRYSKILCLLERQSDIILDLTNIVQEHQKELNKLSAANNINDVKVEMPITEEEFNLIARVVSAEAKGESYEGQCLVAQVIKNRSELWNMSISDVIYAPNQFVLDDNIVSESITNAVCDVFVNGKQVTEEPITHFHASYVNPSWTKAKIKVLTEGNHVFYK